MSCSAPSPGVQPPPNPVTASVVALLERRQSELTAVLAGGLLLLVSAIVTLQGLYGLVALAVAGPPALLFYLYYLRWISHGTDIRLAVVDAKHLITSYLFIIVLMPLVALCELVSTLLLHFIFPKSVTGLIHPASGTEDTRLPMSLRGLLLGKQHLMSQIVAPVADWLRASWSSAATEADPGVDGTAPLTVTTVLLYLLFAFIVAFLVAALIEECSKFVVVWVMVRSPGVTTHPYGGVLHGLCAALGFSLVETALYAFNMNAAAGLKLALATALLRGLLALPLHVFSGMITARGVAIQRFGAQALAAAPSVPGAARLKRLVAMYRIWPAPMLPAILLHGTYDFIAISSVLLPPLGFGIIPVLVVATIVWHRILVRDVWAIAARLGLPMRKSATTALDQLLTCCGLTPGAARDESEVRARAVTGTGAPSGLGDYSQLSHTPSEGSVV